MYKAVNYPGTIKVKVRRLGGRLTGCLPGSLSYGTYLRVKDFYSEKGAALSIYNGTVAVGYKALTGKLKAVYLILEPVSIYDGVISYYTKLLFVKRRRQLL